MLKRSEDAAYSLLGRSLAWLENARLTLEALQASACAAAERADWCGSRQHSAVPLLNGVKTLARIHQGSAPDGSLPKQAQQSRMQQLGQQGHNMLPMVEGTMGIRCSSRHQERQGTTTSRLLCQADLSWRSCCGPAEPSCGRMPAGATSWEVHQDQ